METAATSADPEAGWDDPQQSIEDQAANPQPDGPPPVAGLNRQLSLLAGGEEPDASSFRVVGGKVAVEGEFKKGDVIELVIKASVDTISFVDTKDKDGFVVGTERQHKARILSVRRV